MRYHDDDSRYQLNVPSPKPIEAHGHAPSWPRACHGVGHAKPKAVEQRSRAHPTCRDRCGGESRVRHATIRCDATRDTRADRTRYNTNVVVTVLPTGSRLIITVEAAAHAKSTLRNSRTVSAGSDCKTTVSVLATAGPSPHLRRPRRGVCVTGPGAGGGFRLGSSLPVLLTGGIGAAGVGPSSKSRAHFDASSVPVVVNGVMMRNPGTGCAIA